MAEKDGVLESKMKNGTQKTKNERLEGRIDWRPSICDSWRKCMPWQWILHGVADSLGWTLSSDRSRFHSSGFGTVTSSQCFSCTLCEYVIIPPLLSNTIINTFGTSLLSCFPALLPPVLSDRVSNKVIVLIFKWIFQVFATIFLFLDLFFFFFNFTLSRSLSGARRILTTCSLFSDGTWRNQFWIHQWLKYRCLISRLPTGHNFVWLCEYSHWPSESMSLRCCPWNSKPASKDSPGGHIADRSHDNKLYFDLPSKLFRTFFSWWFETMQSGRSLLRTSSPVWACCHVFFLSYSISSYKTSRWCKCIGIILPVTHFPLW